MALRQAQGDRLEVHAGKSPESLLDMKMTENEIAAIRFVDGLIPAIVQDAVKRDVLMMAWMNRTALEMTLKTGQTHFYSRSRARLWRKGETSGHVQAVRAVRLDCDRDALLVEVDQTGVACHTGKRSCFFHPLLEETSPDPIPSDAERHDPVEHLAATIAARKTQPDPASDSYTHRLFEAGIDAILKKVAEEAGELIISAKNDDRQAIIGEAADLLYHLMVTLAAREIAWSEVTAEIAKRSGQSGLAEKRARKTKRK